VKRVVLVNGVPASGKSTVARLISSRRQSPMLGLDTIKEPFFGELGFGDREYNRKLGRASYRAIFDLIGAFPDGMTAVVDAWFGFQPLEVLTGHLARAGVGQALEVWCYASPEMIAERYAARIGQRSPGHPGAEYVPELLKLAQRAQPFRAFPCIEVDTAAPLDHAALLGWVDEQLSGASSQYGADTSPIST